LGRADLRDTGKVGELLIAIDLLKAGFEVYQPLVDKGTDLLAVEWTAGRARYYEIQVKRFRAYNLVTGVYPRQAPPNYFFAVIYYQDDGREERYFLTREEAIPLARKSGDLRFNKRERARFANRALPALLRGTRSTSTTRRPKLNP